MERLSEVIPYLPVSAFAVSVIALGVSITTLVINTRKGKLERRLRTAERVSELSQITTQTWLLWETMKDRLLHLDRMLLDTRLELQRLISDLRGRLPPENTMIAEIETALDERAKVLGEYAEELERKAADSYDISVKVRTIAESRDPVEVEQLLRGAKQRHETWLNLKALSDSRFAGLEKGIDALSERTQALRELVQSPRDNPEGPPVTRPRRNRRRTGS